MTITAPAQTPEPTPPSPRRRRFARRQVIAGALALSIAAGVPSAWALDRFVIDHVEVANVSAYEAQQAADGTTTSADSASAGTVAGTTYTSDLATITITTSVTGTGSDTVTAYIADVQVADGTTLRSAFAEDSFGTNIVENTSDIAQGVDAIFAINGDYYGFRDTGIVVRNGVAYRDEGARQGLAIYRDGAMRLYDETTTSAQELVDQGVYNTLSFGPGLVENGQVIDGIDSVEVDTNFGNHSVQGTQPRTGIGVIDANHFVFIVVDGRSEGYSKGVTMSEFAQMFADLGATTAYNLDGGGSSTMYFNGDLVNNPLGRERERGTSDILYIAG